MAICEWCGQDMRTATGCTTKTVLFPDGVIMASIPYDGDFEVCHDCKATLGECHHPGCDMERCPRCGGQLISCGCLDEE